jgi:hypothetical protein
VAWKSSRRIDRQRQNCSGSSNLEPVNHPCEHIERLSLPPSCWRVQAITLEHEGSHSRIPSCNGDNALESLNLDAGRFAAAGRQMRQEVNADKNRLEGVRDQLRKTFLKRPTSLLKHSSSNLVSRCVPCPKKVLMLAVIAAGPIPQ